jgi:hypothetical protein
MNINMGPMIQFNSRDTPKTFVFLNTSFSFSYRTLAKGGYIINISPTAKGMLVVPDEKELMNVEEEGKKYPMATPIPIAKNIHKVKYLSKKLNRFRSFAGAQSFADIILVTVF